MAAAALLSLALTLNPAVTSDPTGVSPGPDDLGILATVRARAPALSAAEAVRWAHTIEISAHERGVDPRLVLAVITVESGFDPRAVSPVGARGLMQLMPKTGRQWARRLGIPWRGPRTLFDPLANIQIGAAYLAWLQGRFRGRRSLALAAYCHGPGLIRRLARRGALTQYRLRYAGKVARAEAALGRRFRWGSLTTG
ncbi:MAG: lytic transglycosylase domain-containing protein [Deltaproteobacteria bacterium]|nr:lytic transglycosylase domain-containing protein [Deltaproteobacteria bacterium]